ncbi:F-box/LRR-repeat protein 20-like [Pristis pectinata]|uniref:F-box/LRR-repeat protein 20-like n=1 Tax=Pristis pectinata TaxID=685728 RepID=UPI00223E532E|nr:F-box/LRR-repeat protein 20-like [Pristis pectinata]
MTMSKGSWKQPFKRPLSANVLDNKQAPQEAQRSKTLLQNTAVVSRPTMKPWEISKYFRNNAPQSCDKLIFREDGNRSPWLYLPDEIWLRIFALLPHRDLCQVARVCYCFHRLANDETLWKNIKIENSNCLNDKWLKNIGHHQPRSLSLCRCNDRTKSITDSGLRELFRHSKDSLKELYVTCCSGPKLTGDSVLLHASAVCHKLTSVDVSWTAATDKGIIALAQASSCLYRLLANGCHLTDESINILIKKHRKSLRELELFGCHALSSHCLTHMAQECLNLQSLNIGRIPKLTTTCLIQIVTSLKNLSALNLSGLNAVHDSVVHHTARQCPKMDRLILSSCLQLTDVSLFEIGTYLSTIR